MIRNVLGFIAAMLMTGAASAAPASGPSYLGNWARADGKTHIRVEPCGKSVCGVNTWVRPGVKHEKVGDRLVLKIRPAGGVSRGDFQDSGDRVGSARLPACFRCRSLAAP